MWQTQYIADSQLAPERIRAALRDLQTGAVPLSSGERRELTGPFAAGGILATETGTRARASVSVRLRPHRRYDELLQCCGRPAGQAGQILARPVELAAHQGAVEADEHGDQRIR